MSYVDREGSSHSHHEIETHSHTHAKVLEVSQMDMGTYQLEGGETFYTSLEPQQQVQVIEVTEHNQQADASMEDSKYGRKDGGHAWSVYESVKLIEIMKSLKDDMSISKNKKQLWDKVLQEMLNQNISVSLQECQNKWKNMTKSFKEACKIKNPNKMRFKYFKEMKDYFGPEQVAKFENDWETVDGSSGVTLYQLTNGSNTTGASGAQSSIGPKATVTFPPICFTDRQFIEYTKMKREEYARRQKRHEEEMKVRKDELDVQKKQLDVMKKSAMASNPNRTINYDFPCRWPDEATQKLIQIISQRKREMADRDQTKKPELWRQIRQQLVDEGYEVTVKECKMKWRNLIRTYNLRCRNQRQKGFKFKFFDYMQSFFEETEPVNVDPVVFHIYPIN